MTLSGHIDAAFDGPRLVPADPILQACMREFIRKCEDGFDAIVKLTMVKYILPKLKKRWTIEELTKQAARRPTKYYQDLHSRDFIIEQSRKLARSSSSRSTNTTEICCKFAREVPQLSHDLCGNFSN